MSAGGTLNFIRNVMIGREWNHKHFSFFNSYFMSLSCKLANYPNIASINVLFFFNDSFLILRRSVLVHALMQFD